MLLFYLQEDTVEYGIDMSGPVCLADDSERVVVPEVPSILNDTQVSLLHSLVDPLEPCDDCGYLSQISIFIWSSLFLK